jgi:hypothetical protein
MKLGRSVKIPGAVCTQCGKQIDGASAVGEEATPPPSPGDFAICIYCGHLMAYGEVQQLRELTDAEMLKAAGDPRIVAMQQARQVFWKERGRK